MKKFFFILLLLVCWPSLHAQQKVYSGYIRDAQSGEALIGANIYVQELGRGASSNTYGYFSLSLPAGTYRLRLSYLGYEHREEVLVLAEDAFQTLTLTSIPQQLQGVEVTSTTASVETTEVSKISLPVSRIATTPALGGISDVMKTLQLMPGIQSVHEGSGNLYVRGGTFDQNLILLDEAPVYNPSHVLGFFSTFNTDALKNVTVYKGAFPVQYGGRLSSVVDISMRDGNYNKTQVQAGVGLIASNLTVEGPLAKGKASYMLSGRYSYGGHVLNAIHEPLSNLFNTNINGQNNIWFYDFNAKFNYKINEKNHLYLSSYSGHDNFLCNVINEMNEMKWGNWTTTLRWNHVFSQRLFSTFTLYHSRYNYNNSIAENINNYDWKSHIRESGGKGDFSFFWNARNELKAGFSLVHHGFSPGEIVPLDRYSIIEPFSLDRKRSLEGSLYVGNEQTLTSFLQLNYGLRYTLFANMGPGTVYRYDEDFAVRDSSTYRRGEIVNTYSGWEPRLSARFRLNDKNSIKVAYAHTVQFLHLLSNSTAGLPTDTWVPPDAYIRPQSANQYTLGYYRSFAQSAYELTAEIYYKDLRNIIDYIDNANLFVNPHVQTQVRSGTGYSYGLELLLEKKLGALTGWLGYTYAQTQHKIPGVNKDRPFSPRHDIRHNFSATASYQFPKKWTLSATFKWTSGGFISLPEQMYTWEGQFFYYYPNKNNYAMPAYHRLDLSAVYKSVKNKNRRWKSEWHFAIFNVYNRKNIYSIHLKRPLNSHTPETRRMYLFGIVPSVTYQIRF